MKGIQAPLLYLMCLLEFSAAGKMLVKGVTDCLDKSINHKAEYLTLACCRLLILKNKIERRTFGEELTLSSLDLSH